MFYYYFVSSVIDYYYNFLIFGVDSTSDYYIVSESYVLPKVD